MSESLNAEAIQKIVDLTEHGAKTEFVHPEWEPDHIYYSLRGDKCERFVAEPGPLCATFSTEGSFIEFAKAHHGERACILLSQLRAVYLFDEENRRDYGAMQLFPSEPFLWLEKSASSAMTQSDLVRLLRVMFANCLPNGNLLSIIRNMKFTMASEAAANIQHGRESIGKNIQSQVTGESAVPEEVTLTVPMWKRLPYTVAIPCAIEILSQEQRFRLTPFPGNVENAARRGLEMLASAVSESLPNVPVYLGMIEG